MDGSLLLLGIAGTELSPGEAALFRKLRPAGYILFRRNIATPAQTRKLTDDLRDLSEEPPIIGIDEEGGRVSRLSAFVSAAPSAPALAARADSGKTADAAVFSADLLALLGFNLNFAPVLDLDHFPGEANALSGRSWGRDPQLVIDHAGHWNRWHRKRRIATCGKHFPAGGLARSDPHHDLPRSQAGFAELLREDVVPYTALMPELDAVMAGHVEFPEIDADHPASLSPRMIRQFLREQLGFDKHLVLTDDLDMGAIAQRYGRSEDVKLAIQAGNDLAMICHRSETAEAAARAIAELPLWLRDEARERIASFHRRKLHPPPAWSDKRLAGLIDALGALAAEFPECAGPATHSPVTGY